MIDPQSLSIITLSEQLRFYDILLSSQKKYLLKFCLKEDGLSERNNHRLNSSIELTFLGTNSIITYETTSLLRKFNLYNRLTLVTLSCSDIFTCIEKKW